MNGDNVRNIRFRRVVGFGAGGYDASQVDDLFRRVAAELDAGRPAGPLIEDATFQLGCPGYFCDDVDWFLDQLDCREDASQSPGMVADPWRDFPVASYFTHRRLGERAGPVPPRSWWRVRPSDWQQEERSLAEECQAAWRDFGQQPGARLLWVRAGARRRELLTAEQQTTAVLRLGRPVALSTGERTFTWQQVTGPSLPGIAELIHRSRWEGQLRFLAADTAGSRKLAKANTRLGEAYNDHGNPNQLLDETGLPVLYTSGSYDRPFPHPHITFPDGRWLRFPVRGNQPAHAIMTAIDRDGNKIARYRPRAWP